MSFIDSYKNESMIQSMEAMIEEQHQKALEALAFIKSYFNPSTLEAPPPVEEAAFKKKRGYAKTGKFAKNKEQTPKKTQRQTISEFLERNCATWFTISEIAHYTNIPPKMAYQVVGQQMRGQVDRQQNANGVYEYRRQQRAEPETSSTEPVPENAPEFARLPLDIT